MAKTNAPLLSWGASGTIAKTQVYSTWKGRSYVRRHVIPANPNSPAQQETRNTWKFLNKVWAYVPAGAIGAWDLYATNSRFTPKNGWLKQNLSPLREETDLANIVLSVAAGSGIIADSMTPTPAATSIEVVLVAPPVPVGWTIVRAWAMAIKNVDPQTSADYQVTAGSDDTSAYEIDLTGLEEDTSYVVGGWFEYTKPDGKPAYGQSMQAVVTTAA